MKQILLIGAGNEFPQGAFNFLLGMQQQEPVSVTGLFFSPINFDGRASASYVPVITAYDRVIEKEHETVAANKAKFAKLCDQHHIRHTIHENVDEWDKHVLIKESRFSDLILLSGELFYSDIVDSQPNHFLHEALVCAECPMVIVPEDYKGLDHLYIAYDGSKESMFAMKQFSYLFPQLSELPTEVVYVKDEANEDIPDLVLLRNYSKQHFGSMGFSKLQFKASTYFATWIGELRNVMLVTGSYGRNALSYMTKRSFCQDVIRQHRQPVFIAHW